MVDAIFFCPKVFMKSLVCIMFHLVKYKSESEVFQSGQLEKLKNN